LTWPPVRSSSLTGHLAGPNQSAMRTGTWPRDGGEADQQLQATSHQGLPAGVGPSCISVIGVRHTLMPELPWSVCPGGFSPAPRTERRVRDCDSVRASALHRAAGSYRAGGHDYKVQSGTHIVEAQAWTDPLP
jgi:hypothetical protein